MSSERAVLARQAALLSGASASWGLVTAALAIVVGAATQSLGLVAFGLDSLLDGSASAVLVWRFSVELHAPERAARVEMVAQRVVAAALLAGALYIGGHAIVDLNHRSRAEPTSFGVGLATASVIAFSIFAFLKLRLARELRSGALRADGILSAAGAAFATAAVVGLALSGSWWWADAVAALIIAVALAVEGVRTLVR